MKQLVLWIAWVAYLHVLAYLGHTTLKAPCCQEIVVVRFEQAEVAIEESRPQAEIRILADPAPANDLIISLRSLPGQPAADPGSDYEAPRGSLIVPAGRSSVILPIKILNDSIEESEEVFLVELLDGSGYARELAKSAVKVRIIDDDRDPELPVASFDETELDFREGSGDQKIIVRLDRKPRNGVAEVHFQIDGRGAIEGTHYRTPKKSGDIQFVDGSAEIPISFPDNDLLDSGEKQIEIVLTGTRTTRVKQTRSNLPIRIGDNDGPRHVRLAVTNPAVPATSLAESSKTPFEIKAELVGGRLEKDVLIAFSVDAKSSTAESGKDFALPESPLKIPAGKTSAVLQIPVLSDSVVEAANEALWLDFKVDDQDVTLDGPSRIELQIEDVDGLDGDTLVVAIATEEFVDAQEEFFREFSRLTSAYPGRLVGGGLHVVSKGRQPVVWTGNGKPDLVEENKFKFTSNEPLDATFNLASRLTDEKIKKARKKPQVFWVWADPFSADGIPAGAEPFQPPQEAMPTLMWVLVKGDLESKTLDTLFMKRVHQHESPSNLGNALGKELLGQARREKQ